MKYLHKIIYVVVFICIFPLHSVAQTQPTVRQSGAITAGHLATWASNQTINDGGPVGAASISIGGTVTSGTTGSVLYVGSGPILAQDNSNFFWDGTNHTAGIGTTRTGAISATNSMLRIKGSGATSSTSSFEVQNSSASSLLFVRNDGYIGLGTNAPVFPTTIVAPQTLVSTSNTAGSDNTNAVFTVHAESPSAGQILFDVGSSNQGGQFQIIDLLAPNFGLGIIAQNLNVGDSGSGSTAISWRSDNLNSIDLAGGGISGIVVNTGANTRPIILKTNSVDALHIDGFQNVGIGSSIPRSILDISQNTGAIILPIGTTGQEPASPVNGMLRYNSTVPQVEAYANNIWTALGAGAGGGVTSFSGDAGGIISNSSSTGAVAVTFATQSANLFLAGPSSGSAAIPAYRAQVIADQPSAVKAAVTASIMNGYGGL